MNSASKIVFGMGDPFSVLWTNDPNDTISHSWWVDTKFPKDIGIYVWEEGVGVRQPTNKEWWKIIKGENPVEGDLDDIELSEWLR